jgi:hypothetical protein
LGNINRFIRRRKNPTTATDNSTNSSRHCNNFKGKLIIVLGIVIAVIGIAGTIYYGSQFVKEEVNGGGTFPYTTSPQIKNISPIDLEVIFVIVMLVGFGIFTYGFAERVDKPFDFYPT